MAIKIAVLGKKSKTYTVETEKGKCQESGGMSSWGVMMMR